MIKKYCMKDWKMPVATNAVVMDVECCDWNETLFLDVQKTDETLTFCYHLERKDRIYGLGEQVRGINKRGWLYESYCKDDPNHTEDKHGLYGAHNFFIIKGKEIFGCFIDCGGKVTFDFGYSESDRAIIRTKNPCEWYIITGESVLDIVSQFRLAIGKSYVPPKWAFGYQQSRWGYKTKQDIQNVIKEYRKRGIPIDSVYLDIDYMEGYKDFTVHKERFADFEKFVKDAKKEHVRLVPIIDAGVKIEEDYKVYETGKNQFFCKDREGKDFIGGVWPGLVHFPDVLNHEAAEWFGHFYKDLLDIGIEGFWNDMNEPALFYSEEALKAVYEKAGELNWEQFDLNDFLELQPMINQLGANEEDFKRIYHNVNGRKIRHDKVHNLYGYFLTRATMEAIKKELPEKRTLLFSRASYIGMHRYSGIWTGDNKSWWSHLLLNIKMMPSLSMCGFLYAGADIGGFDGDVTEDLLMRWLEFGIFTPLFRNHCAIGRREQEIYQYPSWEQMKELVRLRYRLLPYLYSEFMKAVLFDKMYMKPLCFLYKDDEEAEEIEDQLLVGESIMIAPVYEQNKSGRYVYVPEDMLMIRFVNAFSYKKEIIEKGHHYISMPEGEVVLFVRKNHLLLLGEGGQCVEEAFQGRIGIVGWIDRRAEYSYYDDNGITSDYGEQNIEVLAISKEEEWRLWVNEKEEGLEKRKYWLDMEDGFHFLESIKRKDWNLYTKDRKNNIVF
ncbi:glycoside hydrolase family 31 protein [Velocimicrobium porci]|uniref:Alpha-glucosidase n=1 Tax=Velocimicrobium porci TaxID=2606634 RepID=A0A6L5Y1V6_9FIRM|nr:TIM-barrel domain-containing protein [Velocimicrobium porci]MSS64837.1 alpha-glucosidase [Velocimicrobium porci]